MKTTHYRYLFFLVPLMILTVIYSCSGTKNLVDKITPEVVKKRILPRKPDVKKRVMILPLMDRANIGPDWAARTTATFNELLSKSPYLLIYQAPDSITFEKGGRPPEYGHVPQPQLVKKVEDLDMNALITGTIAPIEITTKKTFIWPYPRIRKIYEVTVNMNVVDVRSGTLYLTNKESVKKAFHPYDVEDMEEKKIINQVFEEALPRIMKKHASVIAKALAKEPWSGKILSIEDNTIMINAGSEVGVRPGHLFEVFAKGESIVSREGKAVDTLGEKIGEIKVTSIMEKHSMAAPVTEGSYMAGQIIRSRR